MFYYSPSHIFQKKKFLLFGRIFLFFFLFSSIEEKHFCEQTPVLLVFFALYLSLFEKTLQYFKNESLGIFVFFFCTGVTVCALTQTTLRTPDARSWMTSWQRQMVCFPLRRESRFHLFSRNGLNAQRVRATNKRRACATRETRTQTTQGIHNSMYYTLDL